MGFVESGVENSPVHKRFAGSDGEKIAGARIWSALSGIFGLVPVSNVSTTNGVQSFDVNVDGNIYVSQNIIFKKPGTAENPKKVVIAAHYDNQAYYVEEDDYTEANGNEGVWQSGAGVGVLLTLAEVFAQMTFEFDIEFVFFGAHYADLAGAEHYSSLISDDQAKNILLMINFDNIVSGGDTYLYMGEFKNDTDEYVVETFSEVSQAKNAYDLRFLANMNESSVTGLSYTTVALESESAHFLRRGVKILNVLSIDSSNIDDLEIVNYVAPESIQNDTYAKLVARYGENLINSLAGMAEGVIGLVSDNNFATKMAGPQNADKYELWGNDKIAVFVTAVLFVILCFVLYLVHRSLSKKAQEAKLACNFDALMAEVASGTYESVEELVNEFTKKMDSVASITKDKDKSKQDQNDKDKKSDEKKETDKKSDDDQK